MAALVLVCGGPASGKTATAQAVAAALRDAGMPVVVVSEEGDPATLYADPPSEKQTRGALRSRVDRALASSKPPPAVVVDGCNAVKGFRYELWCLGRPSGARFCCVFCPEPGSSSSGSSGSSGGGGGGSGGGASPSSDEKTVGRWPRALFDDLAARVEPPDPRNRWEQPLFVADARRAKTAAATEGDGEGVEQEGRDAAAPVRPAPASLPPGGRGTAVEETAGWPLDAVAAAVMAAVSPPARGAAKKKAADGGALDGGAASNNGTSTSPSSAAAAAPLPDALPVATTSVALRPAKCTLAARVASADALGDLDAAAQAVLLAVAAALSRSSASASAAAAAAAAAGGAANGGAAASSSESAFASIEIPLPADDDDEGDAATQTKRTQKGRKDREEEPLTLSLRRAPSLAELRRHKRDFLRAATAPMAGPLPSGARAGASAFCEYLKRRVV